MNNTPKVQIQAVLFNTPYESVAKSVHSFSNAASRSNIEITFRYGDSSPDKSLTDLNVNQLRQTVLPSAFEYIHFDHNTGYGEGQNILASDCTSDFILAINPDIVVESTFFNHMLKPFSDDETVGIVEARQTPLEHPKKYDKESGETSWASGACMLTPTSLFKKLEGFDSDTFWMYCEDVDYSWRVKLANRKVVYQPRAVAFHPKRLLEDGNIAASKTELFHSALSALLMAYKWSNEDLLHKYLSLFESSDDPYQRSAFAAFRKREATKTLPDRITAPASVASFSSKGDYSENRY